MKDMFQRGDLSRNEQSLHKTKPISLVDVNMMQFCQDQIRDCFSIKKQIWVPALNHKVDAKSLIPQNYYDNLRSIISPHHLTTNSKSQKQIFTMNITKPAQIERKDVPYVNEAFNLKVKTIDASELFPPISRLPNLKNDSPNSQRLHPVWKESKGRRKEDLIREMNTVLNNLFYRSPDPASSYFQKELSNVKPIKSHHNEYESQKTFKTLQLPAVSIRKMEVAPADPRVPIPQLYSDGWVDVEGYEDKNIHQLYEDEIRLPTSSSFYTNDNALLGHTIPIHSGLEKISQEDKNIYSNNLDNNVKEYLSNSHAKWKLEHSSCSLPNVVSHATVKRLMKRNDKLGPEIQKIEKITHKIEKSKQERIREKMEMSAQREKEMKKAVEVTEKLLARNMKSKISRKTMPEKGSIEEPEDKVSLTVTSTADEASFMETSNELKRVKVFKKEPMPENSVPFEQSSEQQGVATPQSIKYI
jgi:hypothetical protein